MAKRKSSIQKKNKQQKRVAKKAKPWHWNSTFWKPNLLPVLVILLLPFALYFQSMQFGYILDDQIVITDNNFTKKGFGGLWDILTTESMVGYFGEQKQLVEAGRYRPLSIMTFAAEYEFTAREYTDYEGDTVMAPHPGIAHAINILLYALTGLLLFRIFSGLLPRKKRSVWLSLGFLTALLFVLHPVHVEVVANVKGRDEILALLLSLVTLYGVLRFRDAQNAIRFGWLAAASVAFFLALLAKENAVTFLAAIPLTCYFFTRSNMKDIVLSTAVLALVFGLYAWLRVSVAGNPLGGSNEITDLFNNPFLEMTTAQKYASISYTLGEYLRLLVFPLSLTHDYYPYQIPISNWIDIKPLLSALAYAGLATAAVFGWKKRSIPAYSILYYLATLSIFTNIIVNLGTFMNERFIYMPSVGFCLLAAWFIGDKLPKSAGRNVAVGLLALLVIGYSVRTVTRVPVWKDALTLNLAAVKVSKNSARANTFAATALYHEYRRNKKTDAVGSIKLLDRAEGYIQKALKIYPDYGTAMTMQSGIAAERYKNDNNLDKLLSTFYSIILKKKQLKFIDEYLDYLAQRGYGQQVADFCYKVGWEHFATKKNDLNFALHYLAKFGVPAAPNDARLLEAVARVYEAGGNAAKAQEYRSRIRN